jgi:hypothetical protein
MATCTHYVELDEMPEFAHANRSIILSTFSTNYFLPRQFVAYNIRRSEIVD